MTSLEAGREEGRFMDVPHRTVPGVEVPWNSQKQNKMKTPGSAPSTNEHLGWFRDTSASVLSGCTQDRARLAQAHVPSDGLRSQDRGCAWEISFLLPPLCPWLSRISSSLSPQSSASFLTLLTFHSSPLLPGLAIISHLWTDGALYFPKSFQKVLSSSKKAGCMNPV